MFPHFATRFREHCVSHGRWRARIARLKAEDELSLCSLKVFQLIKRIPEVVVKRGSPIVPHPKRIGTLKVLLGLGVLRALVIAPTKMTVKIALSRPFQLE